MDLGKLKGCTVVTGFHGIGFVGFIAVDFMVRKLEAERVERYFNRKLPPVVFAGKDKLEMPVEFYRKDKLGFMKLSVMAEKEVLDRVVEETLTEFKKVGVKQVLVVGGLASRHKQEIQGVCNTAGREMMEKLKLAPLDKEITVFGPMASTLIHGERLGLPVVCVLPGAMSNVPDPEAASEAIKLIAGVYGLEIDTQDLEKDARKVEKRLKELDQKDDLTDRMFM
ncbi:MAG TPA: hypothetical protein ENN60_03250 [archaeon]|nr:hypothetical protein [archaeon]